MTVRGTIVRSEVCDAGCFCLESLIIIIIIVIIVIITIIISIIVIIIFIIVIIVISRIFSKGIFDLSFFDLWHLRTYS